MSVSLDSQLYEALRDALVAYTLDEVVPNATQFVNAGLGNKLKTANDLYEYLLLDVQVSQNVQTSPVASAIASLQQYINGALMSMEPGYESKVMEEHRIRQWRDIDSQYSIWAGDQKLQNYPELYIDPSLRLYKSMYFQQLENDLNQNRINVDTAQEAIKNYLTRFEEVANLTIINGYVSTDDFKNGMYYFIGKSRAEDTYYWRSVDMSQRSYKDKDGSNPDRPKFDYPQPGAWSDWHKAQLPISASAIERTIRPVFFNNRLFVFWVECVDNSPELATVDIDYPAPPDADTPLVEVKSHPMLRLNLVYKKYDDSWSVPHTLIQAWSDSPLFKTQDLQTLVESIAVQDHSPDSMLVAMYAGYSAGASVDGSQDAYGFLKTALIDKNFNVEPIFPTTGKVPSQVIGDDNQQLYVLRVGRVFALDNRNRFQFRLPAFSIVIKSVETSLPHPGGDYWDYSNFRARIATPIKGVSVRYDKNLQGIEFESSITEAFFLPGSTLAYFGNNGFAELSVRIVTSDSLGQYERLESGAEIGVFVGQHFKKAGVYNLYLRKYGSVAESLFIREVSSIHCELPAISPNNFASLNGKLVATSLLSDLNNNSATVERISIRNPDYDTLSLPLVQVEKTTSLVFGNIIYRPVSLSDLTPISSGLVTVAATAGALIRRPPDTLKFFLPIDSKTLRPDWNISWPGHSKKIPIIHGVRIDRTINGVNRHVGSALKLTQVELELAPTVSNLLIAPRLNTRASPTLGVAEFIDFTGSGIQMTDGSSTVRRQPIRMNTLFARELINKANTSLETLLSWQTQGLEEPPMEPQTGNSLMDFHGANGKYFWEVFLHLALMVSHRMNHEQQFDAAEQWLGFIFDPSRKTDNYGRPDYWNVRPLMEDRPSSRWTTRRARPATRTASRAAIRCTTARRCTCTT